MKTRLELAHEYAKILLECGLRGDVDLNLGEHGYSGIASDAFMLADAMLAENEKRTTTKEEWQPDWSEVDEHFRYWAVDSKGRAYWYRNKPSLGFSEWVMDGVSCGGDCYDYAPSFNYQGDWRDSLRKRPV